MDVDWGRCVGHRQRCVEGIDTELWRRFWNVKWSVWDVDVKGDVCTMDVAEYEV